MAGGAEDDEPDKLAIAFGRFGRLKRFIGGSIRVSVTYREKNKYRVPI